MSDKLVIKGRIEEVPALSQFAYDNLGRDLADFAGYKPSKYDAAYLADIQTKRGIVEAVVNPKQLTAELKVITLRILMNLLLLRPLMNRLEGYVADATGLTIQPKDFGIKEVRKEVGQGDQEGLNAALLYVIANINNNIAALNAVGFPAGDLTAIQALRQQISDDNAAQNVKMEARAQLVVDNRGTINSLCNVLKEVWADGKRLYRISNKTKAKDYSNAELINRIRAEELKTKITGTVIEDGVGPINKVKIVAKPVIGKRSKTVYTNAEGVFVLAGLKAGAYNLIISKTGFEGKVVQAEAVTSQTSNIEAVILGR